MHTHGVILKFLKTISCTTPCCSLISGSAKSSKHVADLASRHNSPNTGRALLFAHFDADSDGLLSRDEFVALLGLVSAKAGTNYEHEHLIGMFADADIDRNGVLDLNELLVLLRGPKPVPGFGGGGGARSSGGGKGSAELRDARRGR